MPGIIAIPRSTRRIVSIQFYESGSVIKEWFDLNQFNYLHSYLIGRR